MRLSKGFVATPATRRCYRGGRKPAEPIEKMEKRIQQAVEIKIRTEGDAIPRARPSVSSLLIN